jgi:hypothetical protein
VLELRPNCEHCDKDLPPGATDARICSYECTFCGSCVETVLFNVCPRGFGSKTYSARDGAGKGCLPRQAARFRYDREEIARFAEMVRDIPPENR